MGLAIGCTMHARKIRYTCCCAAVTKRRNRQTLPWHKPCGGSCMDKKLLEVAPYDTADYFKSDEGGLTPSGLQRRARLACGQEYVRLLRYGGGVGSGGHDATPLHASE